MIKTAEELSSKIKSCTACLSKKFACEPGRHAILVCGGPGCAPNNSQGIVDRFNELLKATGYDDKVTVSQVGCFGFCSEGPFVKILPEDTLYHAVKVSDIDEIVEKDIIGGELVERLLYVDPDTKEAIVHEKDITFYKKQPVKVALHGCGVIDPENLDEALGYSSMQALIKALSMKPEEVIKTILDSGLRGRGGGGFPTGKKWQFAFAQPAGDKYVVCNGDEGDPGAFMDRATLEGNPVNVIEGMMIAGYAIGAQNGYFYIRAEYPTAVEHIRKAIKDLEAVGLLGDNILGTGFSFRAHVKLGAGAFVCGEETALLHSIEGQRGMPRSRPPFPAVKGLWDKPTIVNNVETLAMVPFIIRNGAESFNKYGTATSKGTKVFALGGKVNNVGLVEVPMGTTLRELVYGIGGGISGGKTFKAIQTGGPSGGCLTAKDLDTPIDYETLIARGSMMGSGGAIVMDEDNCMVDVARFYMDFIVDESCGKCTACRIGTKRMYEILTKITEGKGTPSDLIALKELGETVKNNSLCALGQTSANPILSTMTQFPEEYAAHVIDKTCPAKVCKKLITYEIDPNKCKKCSLCARNCPVGAITGVIGKEAYKIDAAKCIKCGMCITSCRFGAVEKK